MTGGWLIPGESLWPPSSEWTAHFFAGWCHLYGEEDGSSAHQLCDEWAHITRPKPATDRNPRCPDCARLAMTLPDPDEDARQTTIFDALEEAT